MTFKELFPTQKPVFGMLHLKKDSQMNAVERAVHEAEVYLKCGVQALLVENYFGSAKDCADVLSVLQAQFKNAVYGVNILGDFEEAFRLADKYGAKFIQIDSVSGHLRPKEDAEFEKLLNYHRQNSEAIVLGGVRFKYQPVRSGRTLKDDLTIGMKRADAIVVTGEGTGIPTPIGKVMEFRSILGDFPLIVGAGVTLDSAKDSFVHADGAIVGSWFKFGHHDIGNVNEEYVRAFMEKKAEIECA